MRMIPSAEERKYLELILSMATDRLLGRGTDSKKTFTDNLRRIADQMDELDESE